ncbi:hypothetical protein [Blastococcus sp. CCUG 61487]|uniref:hypothetical protein n=1 Tax=Blastococcus sp. CCUG 61487 TaxID=1840703 RepID=UPI0010C046C6|nr:hypothetical protein [Blastococcus sp. CCUG 61487]TKJ33123.1 hypothetical protein A6V29_01615 [Blastococcus sp. CCUG 61487]
MDGEVEPRVLIIGLDPQRVPGPWDPTPVARGIAAGLELFAAAGIGAQICLVGLDGSDDIQTVVHRALCSRAWEVVVVGRGIRDDLELFESVLNLVHHWAPQAAIALNATPEDTFDAASRWLRR